MRTKFDDYPDVLTVKQVAELLNIGINQAYQYANNGTIPALRLGRSIRISKKALQRWLEGGTTDENPQIPPRSRTA